MATRARKSQATADREVSQVERLGAENAQLLTLVGELRTKLNARVKLSAPGQAPIDSTLQDISLGGIGLVHSAPLKIGSLYTASIQLRLNQVDLSIDSQIKIVSQRGAEVGAQFVDLDAQKRDILRYLLSAYLSGEIADVNGLFNVMQRENYIKQRKQSQSGARTRLERARALLGSAGYLAAGLAVALYYALQSLFVGGLGTLAVLLLGPDSPWPLVAYASGVPLLAGLSARRLPAQAD